MHVDCYEDLRQTAYEILKFGKDYLVITAESGGNNNTDM